MPILEDISGEQFHKLTVLSRHPENNKFNQTMWLCKCECGREKIVSKSALHSATVRSCGCIHKFDDGIAARNFVYSRYRRRAKKDLRLDFGLTMEQFIETTQKPCYYCGALPNNIMKRENYNGEYVYNGLDRVDSNKGYMFDNVVPCCRTCNVAKGALPLDEFIKWSQRVYLTCLEKGLYHEKLS